MSSDSTYPSSQTGRVDHVAQLLREARAPKIDGDVRALIVPHADHTSGGALTARILKSVEGQSYHSVIVVAASRGGTAGRIHVSRRETYPSTVGDIPVDLKSVDELCDEDDDIFADDRGHFLDEGIGVQLPFLKKVLGEFRLVPIVMGDESPEFCRELGVAMGEIMYNQPTLVVACVDVLRAEDDAIERFRELLAAGDADGVMRFVNAERITLDGRGPLAAAIIAAQHRQAGRVDVVELTAPVGHTPGRIGAILSRT